MWIIWTLLIGLIIGALARAIMPGDDSMSMLQTSLVGAGGSFLGAFIGNYIGMPNGWLLSIAGALLILLIIRFVKENNDIIE